MLGGCNHPSPMPPVRSAPLITDEKLIRRAWIDRETRTALRGKTHRLELRVPPRAELEVAFGLPPARKPWTAWPPNVDRVDFTIAYESERGSQVLLERPVERPADGLSRWHEATVDLGTLAGQSGTLILDADVHPHMASEQSIAWTIFPTIAYLPWEQPHMSAEPRIAWTNPRLRVPAAEVRTNVILISIDTLRADHLSCYGYDRPTSPHIERMAGEGILFRNFIASSPWTLPSHASMLTGLNPSRHGAQSFVPTRGFSRTIDTLAERLRDQGYDTAGFVGGGFLSTVFGFEQGFDRYWESPRKDDTDTLQVVLDIAKPWVEQRRGAPFFLFLHTYQVHVPYTPPASSLRLFDPQYRGPYQTSFTSDDARLLVRTGPVEPPIMQRLIALYDGEIRAMDAAVGDLLSFLRDTGLARNTCVFFTSDHGEEFGEHGDILHSKAKLYRELIHIPLIVWCPSLFAGGRTVAAIASHTDIVPTILELTGSAAPVGLDGRSLTAALRGDRAPIRDFALSQVDGSMERKPGSVTAVRTGEYTLIESSIDGSTMLFDLTVDPGEQHDLGSDKAALIDALRAAVDGRRSAPVAAAAAPITPDDAARERLRALGYDQ
jgi:arylsulfatase A-like enzyme